MNRIQRLGVLAVLMGCSLGSWAAGEGSEPGPWEKFKRYTVQQKDAAVAEGKALVAETDKKIAALSAQASQSKGEMKSEHAKNMQELQAKKQAAAAQLDKMAKASGQAWDATKEGFANAGKDLHAAYEKAAASATPAASAAAAKP